MHVPPHESEHTISASGATNSIAKLRVTASVAEGEAGRGEVTSASTWDEFPNGRFGDFKSPAYGDQDQWGSSRLSVRCNFCESITAFDVFVLSVMRPCYGGEAQNQPAISLICSSVT